MERLILRSQVNPRSYVLQGSFAFNRFKHGEKIFLQGKEQNVRHKRSFLKPSEYSEKRPLLLSQGGTFLRQL